MVLTIRPATSNTDGFPSASNADTLFIMSSGAARIIMGASNAASALTASGQAVTLSVPFVSSSNLLANRISTSNLVTGPGTSTAPPLQLTSGTVTTTSAPGAIEYDGTAIYGSAGQRGLIPTLQFSAIVPAGSNIGAPSANATSAFGRSFAVTAGVRYQLHCCIGVSRTCTVSATTPTLFMTLANLTAGSLAFSGAHAVSATAATRLGDVFGPATAAGTPMFSSTSTPAMAFAVGSASPSSLTSTHVFNLSGILDVTTGASLTPQFTLSNMGGTVSSVLVLGGSYMSLAPLSSAAVQTAV